MIVDRHPTMRLFRLVPPLLQAAESGVAKLDWLLEDDVIFRRAEAGMA